MSTTLNTCRHCGIPYSWETSPASLRMTFCGALCEQARLGFSLEALERYRPPTIVDVAEAVARRAWEEAAALEAQPESPISSEDIRCACGWEPTPGAGQPRSAGESAA